MLVVGGRLPSAGTRAPPSTTVARKPSGTMPSQVTVYVVFSQSVAAPAGTCAVPVRFAEAQPVNSRQARTTTVRLRNTAAPEPLREMDIGDHLARDAPDGGAPSRPKSPTGCASRARTERPAVRCGRACAFACQSTADGEGLHLCAVGRGRGPSGGRGRPGVVPLDTRSHGRLPRLNAPMRKQAVRALDDMTAHPGHRREESRCGLPTAMESRAGSRCRPARPVTLSVLDSVPVVRGHLSEAGAA